MDIKKLMRISFIGNMRLLIFIFGFSPTRWMIDARNTEVDMSQGQVHITRTNGDVLRSVDSYQSAVRLFEANNLGDDWMITDSRGGPTEAEVMILVGQKIRAHFRRGWRGAQYDRILDREIPKPPKVDCDGLQEKSASAACIALLEAGFHGWQAVRGTLHRNSGPLPHAWLERDDGMLLDFMSDRFGLGPVIVVMPHERADSQYAKNDVIPEAFAPETWVKGLAEKIGSLNPAPEEEPDFGF